MAALVVLDGPPRRGLGALVRGLAVVLGVVFLVVGMLAMGVIVLVGLVVISGTSSGDDLNEALVTGAVAVVVAPITLLVARRLLRGRRRMVLFLRRFGFEDATRIVTYAAAQVIGRSWRLVTLDDSRVRPLGGSSGPRRLLGLVALVTVVALVIGGVWLVGGGDDELFDDILAGTEGGDGSLGSEIFRGIAAAVFFGFVLIALLLLAIIVGVTSLFSVASYGAARRAERSKSAVIQTPEDVRRRSRTVDRRSGRIFAPRLVVVRVADPVWQDAVREFARLSDAILVDVSQPSENLLWELDTLLPTIGHRCVLVGRRDTLMTRDGLAVTDPALAAVLDGRTVLAYGTSKAEMRRFARALERFLLETVRR